MRTRDWTDALWTRIQRQLNPQRDASTTCVPLLPRSFIHSFAHCCLPHLSALSCSDVFTADPSPSSVYCSHHVDGTRVVYSTQYICSRGPTDFPAFTNTRLAITAEKCVRTCGTTGVPRVRMFRGSNTSQLNFFELRVCKNTVQAMLLYSLNPKFCTRNRRKLHANFTFCFSFWWTSMTRPLIQPHYVNPLHCKILGTPMLLLLYIRMAMPTLFPGDKCRRNVVCVYTCSVSCSVVLSCTFCCLVF